MITLVHKALSYVVGSKDSNISQEATDCTPKLEDFVAISHNPPEIKEFEGTVTSIDSSCVVIDQDVYCEPTKFASGEVYVGARVKGLAQRLGKHETWRVKRVELMLEEWDTGPCNKDKNPRTGHTTHMNINPETTPCKEQAEEISGIFNGDLLSSQSARSNCLEHTPKKQLCGEDDISKAGIPDVVIGKVTGIYGDTVTLNDRICFKLSSASHNLDMIAGDWIVCDVEGKSTVDGKATELHEMMQVSSVKPIRKKRVRGEVTHSYPSYFIINQEIFCSRALPHGNRARTGDTMTVDVIESHQGWMCWRAVAITSATTAPSTQELGIIPVQAQLAVVPQLDMSEYRMQDLLQNKEGIWIAQEIRFPVMRFGSAAFTDLAIKNNGSVPRTLRRVYFVSATKECQFSVTPWSMDDTSITLEPGAEFIIQLHCAGGLIGLIKQLCIFEFENFQIGRYVSASVEDPLMASLAPGTPFSLMSHNSNLSPVMPEERSLIHGQKSFKPSPFIPVKLPGVHVPEYLWQAVARGDLRSVTGRLLAEPMTAQNYKEKFSLLLHLEEIETTHQMQKFDIARASFIRYGEFLSLTVPGLAEKRPSLLIGDTVVATDPCNTGGLEYEGCIHQVLHTQVLLKFHPSFHNNYYDEDYRVRFNFNRTPLRRCHFALRYTLEQLGQDVLFPSKLKLQLPQVCYIDPEAHKVTKRWMSSPAVDHGHAFEVEGIIESCTCEWEGDSSRLPVVTRLFGVSLQSPRSSLCYNDAEHRFTTVSERDTQNRGKINNWVHTGDTEGNICLTKFDSAAGESKTKVHSQKQEVSIQSLCVGDCSQSVNCSNSVNTGILINTSNKQEHKEEETKLPVYQVRNSPLEPLERVKPNWSRQQHKDMHISTTENEFIPRPLELALLKKLKKSNVSENKDQTSEKKEIVCCEKQVVSSKCFENYMSEDSDLKCQERTNQMLDGGICSKKKKEKSFNKEQCLKASDLKQKQKKICGHRNEQPDTTNTRCYVIPVLPFCLARKKVKENLQQLPILKWFNQQLNQEQKLAVRRILEGSMRPLPYVIFGPPGTGKTVTLVEVALQIFTMVHHSRLLIATPSNSASDLVTERLVESGQLGTTDLVRLNAFQRLRESIPEVIQPYCCTGDDLDVRVHQRVVVTTATTAGTLYMMGLHKGHFTHVLLDEAGQMTEPESLVPLGLVNRSRGQIVLAGDPKQLGPVVQNSLARQGGLQHSLLERLCQTVLYQAEVSESSACVYEPSLVTQLMKNYRSHPDILAVPSRLFYNNKLQACADTKMQHNLLSWKELPCASCPLLFHGVIGSNLQEGDSPSWFNPAEAFQVVRYTKSLLMHGAKQSSIGIITPYRKQIEKIRKLLTTFGIDGVKVGSVEEFQGQERSVILISTVRSSNYWLEEDTKHSLGFIKCYKRFNVAITRAQNLLVVVGNPLLLSMDDSWREFLTFCHEKGCYRGPEVQPGGMQSQLCTKELQPTICSTMTQLSRLGGSRDTSKP